MTPGPKTPGPNPGPNPDDAPLSISSYDLDEALIAATRADGQNRVRVFCPSSIAVVLGRSSRPSVELHTEPCVTDGVDLRRRRGGGCSVVLDPGSVVVAASITAPGLRLADHFARLSAWLMEGLEKAGVDDVSRRDVSDLCLGDRKIAGACMFRARGLILYTVSLLVEPDLSLMDRYLRHPPREPAYRRGRAHTDFVTTIGGQTGLTTDQVATALQDALTPPSL